MRIAVGIERKHHLDDGNRNIDGITGNYGGIKDPVIRIVRSGSCIYFKYPYIFVNQLIFTTDEE